jgi:hypothetical protein
MQGSSSVQHCLSPLASVFSFPRQDFEFSARVDAIIDAGEYAVSVVFMNIRTALAEGEGGRIPMEMETLSGLAGTGITLLEAFLATAGQKNIEPLKQEKLRSLLEEYKKLFEDIELFSGDISAEDCFRAAYAGKAFSDLNTAEEDAAWRDL